MLTARAHRAEGTIKTEPRREFFNTGPKQSVRILLEKDGGATLNTAQVQWRVN
jgi:hypothetical protein